MTRTDISREFSDHFGTNPDFLVRAPGRINLIGEHTDYNDGFVLPSAVNRHMFFAFRPRQDGLIRVTAFDLGETVVFHEGRPTTKAGSWVRFIEGTYLELKKIGFNCPGFDCLFSSTIPIGGGMSSSSALECGILAGINIMGNEVFTPRQLVDISQRANHNFLGLKGGVMDQFACFFGKKGKAILLDCRDLSHTYVDLDLADCSLFLADTRVSHELVDSPYNDRVAACNAFIKAVHTTHPHIHSIRDISSREMEEFDKKHYPGKREAGFVVRENARVLSVVQALKGQKSTQIGQLLYQSHEGLSRDYRVSCRELDFLVEQTKRMPEVLGARMMGGGFGGCTINLCRKDGLDIVKTGLEQSFKQEFGHDPGFYPVETADGLEVIR